MKTRNKRYSDYGFSTGEEKRLLQFCQSSEFEFDRELLAAAVLANSTLAGDIHYSIISGISYDDLCKEKQITACKNDFYGYRRKALANMRTIMKFLRVNY